MNTSPDYTLSQRESTELKLYRILGIKWFQSACFALENWKHRKDGGIHSNYHIRTFSDAGISHHFAYLSFNMTVHLVSLLLLIVHVAVICLIGFRRGFWEIGVVIFAVLNIYCILLQRYNALRFKKFRLQFLKHREMRIQKNVRLLQNDIPENAAKEGIEQDLAWLGELKKAVTDGNDFFIAGEDAKRLLRLNEWRVNAGVKWHYGCKKIECRTRENTPDGEAEKQVFPLYTRKDVKADWIWRHISRGKKKLLKSFALVTADAQSERAFRELFEEDSEDRILEVADSFLEM